MRKWPGRSRRGRWETSRQSGLHPTDHTDFIAAPLDQMMMLSTVVNRISHAGAEIGPGQLETAIEGSDGAIEDQVDREMGAAKPQK